MAIERADRDKIEDGEANIGNNEGDEEYSKSVWKEMNDKGDCGGKKEIADWPCYGNNSGVSSGSLEIIWIKRGGFAPAKGETTSREEHEGQRKSNCSNRVDMGKRIKSQAPGCSGRWVSKSVCGKGVSEFMDGYCEDK